MISIYVASVLSKLQIIKSMELTDCITSEQTTLFNYTINFNVYVSSQQKKSDLGEPNFRVVLCRFVESTKFFIKVKTQRWSKKIKECCLIFKLRIQAQAVSTFGTIFSGALIGKETSFCNIYMWCIARFGTICTILKNVKTPIEEC